LRSGDAVKAINNVMNTAHVLIAAEGLLALKKFGVQPQVFLSAVGVCCLLSAVCCLLYSVCCRLSAVGYLLSAVSATVI
jgi:hypothetical protein